MGAVVGSVCRRVSPRRFKPSALMPTFWPKSGVDAVRPARRTDGRRLPSSPSGSFVSVQPGGVKLCCFVDAGEGVVFVDEVESTAPPVGVRERTEVAVDEGRDELWTTCGESGRRRPLPLLEELAGVVE